MATSNAGAAGGPAPVEQRSQTAVTADSLPTVQIDSGVVWSQAVVGRTVYAGGSFSQTRPAGATPGTWLTPRTNLLAYNIDTGNLVTSFAPRVNGAVKVVRASADGSRIYIGGSFTQVDGQSRYGIAAFDTATGALISSFNPGVGGSYVNAMAVNGSTVYIGGLFTQVAGVARNNLAAVTASGSLTGWAPTANFQVDAMVMAPAGDSVVIGGRFSTVNGSTQRGMASLSATTGAMLPWAVANSIHNGTGPTIDGSGAGISSLTTDGNAIYGTTWSYNRTTDGDFEGAFSVNPANGAINWLQDCHGDEYGGYSDGTQYYSVGHAHACESVGGFPETSAGPNPDSQRQFHYAMAFTSAAKGTLTSPRYAAPYWTDRSGNPAPAIVDWFPDWIVGTSASGGTGQWQAGWDVQGSGDYILVAGEFQGVNNNWQQGIARFARPSAASNKQGPRLNSGTWATPSAVAITAGARVSIGANWDRDDMNLTYELLRSGTSTPVASTTVASTFWNRPNVTLTDQSATAGQSVSYSVRVKDGSGNAVVSNPSATVTVPGQGVIPVQPNAEYSTTVLADGPVLYWPLTGPNAAVAGDLAGGNTGTGRSGVSLTDGVIGANATHFDGTPNGMIGASKVSAKPGAFSLEIWFRTTTTQGGKLIGFSGNTPGTPGGPNDRVIFMRNDGKLTFAVWPNTIKTITSSGAYNNGSWHHVVATQGTGGLALYVDGAKVASDTSVTTAENTTGYWQVGGGYLGAWPSAPSSAYLNGDLEQAAVYGKDLTATRVSAHVKAGRG